MKTLVAGLFACAVLAHSPQLFAQEAPAPAVATPAVPALDSAAPIAPDAAADDHAEPEAAASEAAAEPPADTDKHDVGMSRLVVDLKKVEAEREQYSRFWPWFTVTAGAALTVGSSAIGASKVFGCDGGCSTSAWIGILVATGTLVATLGTIWVVHADADVREIDSRRYQLEQEIERIRISAKLPNAFDNQSSSPIFSMRFALR